MKSGFIDASIGCLLNIVAFIFVIILVYITRMPGLFLIFFFIVPVSFMFGKKLLVKYCGPNTALWLYTGQIGVEFAYLSISLFRQDKKFTQQETERLCSYYAKEFGQEVYKIAKAFVIKNMKRHVSLREHTKNARNLPHRQRLVFLYHLFSMTLADGKLHPREELFLKRVAACIRINEASFDNIKERFVGKKEEQSSQSSKSYQSGQQQKGASGTKSNKRQFFSPLLSAYLCLQVNESASNEDIKKAYRQLAKKHHPDKLTQLNETKKKQATTRFREITEAYELIKKERGIK